jgi:hypothetical protein
MEFYTSRISNDSATTLNDSNRSKLENPKLLQKLKLYFTKNKKPQVNNAYDSAMNCLCFQCPTCMNAVDLLEEENSSSTEDLPKLSFITKFDCVSGKTMARRR